MKVLAQRTNAFLHFAAGREKGKWSEERIVTEVPCLHVQLANTWFFIAEILCDRSEVDPYVAAFIVLRGVNSACDISTLFCIDGCFF